MSRLLWGRGTAKRWKGWDGTILAKLAKKSDLLEAVIPSRCVLNLHQKVARTLSDSPCESYKKK